MDGVLRARAKQLTGILNGVDYAVWNPATDPALISRYDAEDASAKARCKADLQQKLGLPAAPRRPPSSGWSPGWTRRRAWTCCSPAAAQLLRQDVQLVIQGAGRRGA